MPLAATNPSLARRCLTRSLRGCHELRSPRAARVYSPGRLTPDSERQPVHAGACSDGYRVSAKLISKPTWISPSSGTGDAPLAQGHIAGAFPTRTYTSAAGRISCGLNHDFGNRTTLSGRGYTSASQDENISLPSQTTHAAVDDRDEDLMAMPTARRDAVAEDIGSMPVFERIERPSHRAYKRRGAATAHFKRRTHPPPTPRSRRHSPNEYLMYALEKTDNEHGIPPGDKRRADPLKADADEASLQVVLAKYILGMTGTIGTTASQQATLDPGSTTLTTADEKYLVSKGYEATDLAQWAALLVARDIHVPATMLFGPQRKTTTWPPGFLFRFILQRKTIQPRTLQILLRYAWDLLDHRRAASEAIGRNTVMRIFVRLLRHARQVWPEAVVSIAQIISSHIRRTPDLDFEGTELDMLHHSRVSALYNRVLAQLAEPMVLRPFKSSVYQEIAQFDLLHAMASHRPPLRISGKGYRAVTRVLLSRIKTDRERDWTSLQASSWPPWKRARTGIDEEKDLEYGMSRAAISIERMIEAGYDIGRWGDIAKIYAGRDVDGSPVAQTRAFLNTVKSEEADARTWEARIKTTRTVREAWACFLSSNDAGIPPSELVYSAMIIRLLLSQKTMSNGKASSPSRTTMVVSTTGGHGQLESSVMAGDAIEPLPEPTFPRDRTYVPSDPPSSMELFEEMLDKGLLPSEGMIRSILQHSWNVEDGFKFLDVAGPPYSDWLRVLLSGDQLKPDKIQSISGPIFNSFVAMLCRSPRSGMRLMCRASRRDKHTSSPTSGWYLRRQSPALHALWLLFLRRSTNQSLWAAVLNALSDWQAQLAFGGPASSLDSQAILKLRMMRRVLVLMKHFGVEPGTVCLGAISTGVENAAMVSHRVARPKKSTNPSADWMNATQEMTESQLHEIALSSWRGRVNYDMAETEGEASRFLEALFHGVVSGDATSLADASASLYDGSQTPIPPLLAVPSPAELHSYVRALGVLGDHEGILSLVQWMAEHHEAIWLQVLEERGGKRRFATLLAAVRVFLECPQSDGRVVMNGLSRKMKPAGRELIEMARESIDKVPDWNWPDKSLIRQYSDWYDVHAEADKAKLPSLSDYL